MPRLAKSAALWAGILQSVAHGSQRKPSHAVTSQLWTLPAITLSTALHSDCGHMTSGQAPEKGGVSAAPGKLSSSRLAWRAKMG